MYGNLYGNTAFDTFHPWGHHPWVPSQLGRLLPPSTSLCVDVFVNSFLGLAQGDKVPQG